MLNNRPYETRQTKITVPITEFYTTAEVKEKYNVVDSWIFVVAKKIYPEPSIEAKPIGVKNTSITIFRRKLPIRK